MWGRCVFKTENNHFGLCPGAAQVGDIVAVFASASTLFILRPVILAGETHTEPNEPYFLVGDFYVDGIMNSESIEEWH